MKKFLYFSLTAMLILVVALTGCSININNPSEVNHGCKVVFSSDRNVNLTSWPRCANIFSMNLDGTEVTPLTTDNENTVNCCPELSPDGSKVVFVKEKNYMPTSWKPLYELCVMNADGTDLKTIYSIIPIDSDANTDTVLGLYPSWTPGGLIVFSEYHSKTLGCMKVITANGDILKTYSSDLNLGHFYSAPRVSPDGKKILYLTYKTSMDIRVADFNKLDGSITNQTVFYSDPDCDSPSWLSDGILFTSYDNNDDPHIYSLKQANDTPTQLSTSTGFYPLLSHDGSKIIFLDSTNWDDNSSYEIFSMNLDGTGRRNLTQNTFFDGYYKN